VGILLIKTPTLCQAEILLHKVSSKYTKNISASVLWFQDTLLKRQLSMQTHFKFWHVKSQDSVNLHWNSYHIRPIWRFIFFLFKIFYLFWFFFVNSMMSSCCSLNFQSLTKRYLGKVCMILPPKVLNYQIDTYNLLCVRPWANIPSRIFCLSKDLSPLCKQFIIQNQEKNCLKIIWAFFYTCKFDVWLF
jgi:hypothetical protein